MKKKKTEAFNVEKFCRAETKGPRKKRGQRVISEYRQLKMPWYENFNDKNVPQQ